MTSNKFFKLYSYNIPVMGKQKSIIVSFQDMNYTIIPQFLCEILSEFDDTAIDIIEQLYNDRSGTIREYFNFLEKQQLGFFTDTPQDFPKLNLDWDTPEVIKNAVIEIESFQKLDYKRIVRELDNLLCKHIEVWIVNNYSLDELNGFLSGTSDSVLHSISLVLPYQDNVEEIRVLKQSHPKLDNLYFYKSPRRIKIPNEGIYGIKKDLSHNRTFFKDFKKDEFIIYIEFFTESIHHNPYYNRKICIDKDGHIKNCLVHTNHFGNVQRTALEKVAHDASFRDLWYACSDKIEDVRDSEFRYIWLNTHQLEKLENGNYKIIY